MVDFLFDDMYNAAVARMVALFTTADGYSRLSDAYDLDQNSDLVLKKAWGVRIGPPGGENANEYICFESFAVNVEIIFTRKHYALNSDPATKATYELELINDWEQLSNEIFTNNFGLNDLGYGQAILETFDGVEKFRTENQDYLSLTCSVRLKYNRG